MNTDGKKIPKSRIIIIDGDIRIQIIKNIVKNFFISTLSAVFLITYNKNNINKGKIHKTCKIISIKFVVIKPPGKPDARPESKIPLIPEMVILISDAPSIRLDLSR